MSGALCLHPIYPCVRWIFEGSGQRGNRLRHQIRYHVRVSHRFCRRIDIVLDLGFGQHTR